MFSFCQDGQVRAHHDDDLRVETDGLWSVIVAEASRNQPEQRATSRTQFGKSGDGTAAWTNLIRRWWPRCKQMVGAANRDLAAELGVAPSTTLERVRSLRRPRSGQSNQCGCLLPSSLHDHL